MIPLEDAAVRLPLEFDAERLQADLARAAGIERAHQPGPYHDGSWTGLALYQAGGEQTAMPEFAGLRRYRPTVLRRACAPRGRRGSEHREFVVRGLPSGVQFPFDLERNERVTGVRLVTRSVPTNLICARIGKLTEDTDFPDRETSLELISGA